MNQLTAGERWVVGISHPIEPPFAPEEEAFDGRARFVQLAARDERDMDDDALASLHAFLVWTPHITAATAARLRNCRVLVRYGVGYDRIDLDALHRHGIVFANNPEYGPEDVADTALAMLLGFSRRLFEHDARSRAYTDSWQENRLVPTHHARDATVGIVGVGRIGTSVVRRLQPFGFRLLGYDPYLPRGHDRALGYQRCDDLDDLFAASDFITLHCPLSDETRGFVDARRLALMKPGTVLVNTARGALVDSLDSIEAALRSGRLAAAGLDVLPDEPPRPHTLLDAWRAREPWIEGRLVISPHNAFYSERSWHEARFKAAQTARLFLEGGALRNAVAPPGPT